MDVDLVSLLQTKRLNNQKATVDLGCSLSIVDLTRRKICKK